MALMASEPPRSLASETIFDGRSEAEFHQRMDGVDEPGAASNRPSVPEILGFRDTYVQHRQGKPCLASRLFKVG